MGELLLAGVVRTRFAATELRVWNDDRRILTRSGTACPCRAGSQTADLIRIRPQKGQRADLQENPSANCRASMMLSSMEQ